MNHVLQVVLYVLNLPLMPVGKTTVTLAMLLYILLLFTILILVSRTIRRTFLEKALAHSKLDRNMQNAFAMTSQYGIIFIGAVIILNTAGIEMTALTVVAGALGIGLSLGLQTVAKNVAGGLMILLERPIRIGDRVQIGVTSGEVTRIALRSTTIRNDDRIDIIVPNADFMDQRVSNWSYSTKDIYLNIPVTVAADNDISQVRDLLEKSIKANSKVLSEPPPQILLDAFEGGKLKFNVRVATDDFVSACGALKSELNYDFFKRFKEAQIKLDSPAK
ncbi:MAG: mechanosensitive ion channel [Candidatus Obscuribacterales bacterium]|nr:mechanosensitive ion channel [Candidatus Obscuribacterales bacterium]